MIVLVLFFMTPTAPENGKLLDIKSACATEWKKTLLLSLDLRSEKIVSYY